MASDGVNVGDLASPVVDYDEVYGDNADENTLTESHPNKEQIEVPTATDNIHKEDPRFRNGVKKLVKKGGVGRNTESFDPKSTLVRPDMRILVGTRESKPTQLKHDDVLIVPDFFCPANNWDIYNTLVHEMRDLQKKGEKGSEWISWHEGAHLISKNPTSSPTFQKILSDVAQYFSVADLTSIGTRFNWYRDSNDWKPFHHDSAAFNRDRAKRQNITIGVSFGASRELAFLNAKNDTRLYFPQTNGMLFSFGRDVNIKWKHGVNFCAEEVQRLQEKEYAGYLAHDVTLGRISIILWGLCGVTVEEAGSPPMLTDNTRETAIAVILEGPAVATVMAAFVPQEVWKRRDVIKDVRNSEGRLRAIDPAQEETTLVDRPWTTTIHQTDNMTTGDLRTTGELRTKQYTHREAMIDLSASDRDLVIEVAATN
eukprot:gene16480-11785_t